jgi:hypothetical protein
MASLPLNKGFIKIKSGSLPYTKAKFPSDLGVILLSIPQDTLAIESVSPVHASHNNGANTTISFVIANASSIADSDIDVLINNVLAIASGNFANGHTGTFYYDDIAEAYVVSITPPYEFPDYVGWTIRIGDTDYDYYFKTKITTQLLLTSENVRKLHASYPYLIAVTDAGFDVIDVRNFSNLAYAHRTGGYTTVWRIHSYDSADTVYLGTSDQGIFKILMSNIKNGGDVSQYVSQVFSTLTTPSLDSNNVIDLDGYGNNLVVLLPNSINYFISETTKYSHTTAATISRGYIFLTSTNDLYYSGTGGLYVCYNIGGDWSTIDKTYNTLTTPQIGSNIINGLFIASATIESTDKTELLGNTIFIGTANGLYIIDEDRGNEENSNVYSYGLSGKAYNLLDSNIISIMWADEVRQANSGRIYVGCDSGTFYIIDNRTKEIFSEYTIINGDFGDYLNSDSFTSISII